MQSQRNKSFSSVFAQNQSTQSYSQDIDVPLLCYICGLPDRPNIQIQNQPQKQKVNLSKLNKNPKNTILKSSVQQIAQIPLLSTQRKSISFTHQPKFNTPLQYRPIKQYLIRPQKMQAQSTKLIVVNKSQNNMCMPQYKNEQPHQNVNIRFSYQENTINGRNTQQNNNIAQLSQKNMKTNRNILNHKNISIPSTEASQFYLNRNFSNQTLVRKPQNIKIDTNQYNLAHNLPLSCKNYMSINKIIKQCASKQYIKFDHSQDEKFTQTQTKIISAPKNDPSNQSTEQQIPPPFTYFKDAISLQQLQQNKINSFKKKSSKSSKGSKFLSNLRKASSINQNQPCIRIMKLQKNDSNYSHLGKKTKINVRKVQSFESSQSDQYSQVISQGGRSFLMPQINEVQQMSRISSRSNFKNWQDDLSQK